MILFFIVPPLMSALFLNNLYISLHRVCSGHQKIRKPWMAGHFDLPSISFSQGGLTVI
jgi:hypothetical protein